MKITSYKGELYWDCDVIMLQDNLPYSQVLPTRKLLEF